jgi:hypothetical protein
VKEVLNGPASKIHEFSQFSHHTLVEFVQWQDAARTLGTPQPLSLTLPGLPARKIRVHRRGLGLLPDVLPRPPIKSVGAAM